MTNSTNIEATVANLREQQVEISKAIEALDEDSQKIITAYYEGFNELLDTGGGAAMAAFSLAGVELAIRTASIDV